MARVRIPEKGQLGAGQKARRGGKDVAPPPTEWSQDFKRWLMAAYFRVMFSEPYGPDEGWIRVCSVVIRGSTIIREDGTRMIVSSSAGDQECIDIARSLFERDQNLRTKRTK